MQSVLNVFRNNEGTRYHHGNFASASKRVAVPAATSHPVVIFWKLPVLLAVTKMCINTYLHISSYLSSCQMWILKKSLMK